MNKLREKSLEIFTKFFESQEFEQYGKMARNTEKSIFNQTILNCKNKRIVVSWGNRRFRENYKDNHIRVIANLRNKRNGHKLVERIREGEIKPQKLVSMTHRELAPEIWDERDKRVKAYWDKRHGKSGEIERKDGILTCPKCKKKKTEYSERQVRSSDEPTTKFCYCWDCGYRWKFC